MAGGQQQMSAEIMPCLVINKMMSERRHHAMIGGQEHDDSADLTP